MTTKTVKQMKTLLVQVVGELLSENDTAIGRKSKDLGKQAVLLNIHNSAMHGTVKTQR